MPQTDEDRWGQVALRVLKGKLLAKDGLRDFSQDSFRGVAHRFFDLGISQEEAQGLAEWLIVGLVREMFASIRCESPPAADGAPASPPPTDDEIPF